MAKRNLLLVDADPHSLRVMEVSLRQAGFAVTTAVDGLDALEKVKTCAADLVVSDVQMPRLDGFELCKRLKAEEATRELPFIFLTPQKSVDDQRKGLELGVEDYLSKPLFIRELVTRVKLLLGKREKERLARESAQGRVASGDLADLGLLDLVQVFDAGLKTGAVHLSAAGRDGHLYFRGGKLVDAECGKLSGALAFDRLLRVSGGTFAVDYVPCDRPEQIAQPTQALLADSLHRVDEWGRLLEQLPPLSSVLEVDDRQLSEHLAEVPDEVNGLLRLLDGKRTLEQVVDDASLDALAALEFLCKLYFEGFIREAGEPSSELPDASASPPGAPPESPPAPSPGPAAPLVSAPRTPRATVIFFHPQHGRSRALPPPLGAQRQGAASAPAAPPALPPALPPAEGWFSEPAANGQSVAKAELATNSSAPSPGPTPADIFFGRAPSAPGSAPASAPETPAPAAPAVLVGGAAAKPFEPEPEPEAAQAVSDEDLELESAPLEEAREESAPASRRSSAPLVALAAVAIALLGAAIGYQRLQPPKPARPGELVVAAATPVATPAAGPTPEPAAESGDEPLSLMVAERDPLAEPSSPEPAHGLAVAEAPDSEKAGRPPEARAGGAASRKAGADSDYARLVASGYEKVKANRVGAAAADFGRALAVRPNGSEALIGLGIALVDREPAKAAAFLEKGLAVNPKDARGQVTLGAAYQTLNRNADAVKAYNAYLSIAPHGEYADEVRSILENLR